MEIMGGYFTIRVRYWKITLGYCGDILDTTQRHISILETAYRHA